MPSPIDRPKGCVFANRCPLATDRCRVEVPALVKEENGHAVACFADKTVDQLQAQEENLSCSL